MNKTKSLKGNLLLIIFSLLTISCPAISYASFKDVNENYPYFEAISSLESQGVISGYSGFFMPEKPIFKSRAPKDDFQPY